MGANQQEELQEAKHDAEKGLAGAALQSEDQSRELQDIVARLSDPWVRTL